MSELVLENVSRAFGGFAAAGGSEQSDELAGIDPKVDAGDRDETTEGTRDIFENEF